MIDDSVRQLVRARAGQRCEYCRLPQDAGASIRFHIEHIRPRQHGGDDSPDNLALACPNCNWNKGPNISAVDPATDSIVPLFNPRTHSWRDHFFLVKSRVEGRTSTERATVQLLRLNAPDRLEVRHELWLRGEFRVD
jgi:5-methylcytosine-specific restriction endonuclease McrA